MVKVTQLDRLEKKRASVITRLKQHTYFIENFSTDNSIIEEVITRMDALEPLLKTFQETQDAIDALDVDVDHSEFEIAFEQEYFSTLSRYKRLVKELTQFSLPISDVSSNSINVQNHIKLPTLNLPSFSGQYDQWSPFYDLFSSTVHENTNLNNVQKFQYLKSSLKGEAANILESLPITSDNYLIAWDLLRDRFENKRLIVQSHINSLFNLPTVVKDNAISLRKLLDTVNAQLRALNALSINTNNWDIMIIHLISEKIEFSLRKEWESTLDTDLPKLQDIITFLNHKCLTLESLQNSKKVNIEQKVSSSNKFFQTYKHTSKSDHSKTFSLVSSIPNCPICKEQHFVNQCKKFLEPPVKDRIRLAQLHNLCKNCLRTSHKTRDCRSSTCRKCMKLHNTLLHLEPEINETIVAPVQNETVTEAPQQNAAIVNHCRQDQSDSQVLLSTAIVYVYDKNNQMQPCRCLLDVGSQSNLISYAFFHKLGLKHNTVNFSIGGITHQISNVNKIVEVKMKSKQTEFTRSLTCLILPTLTQNLPIHNFPISNINIPNGVTLADPNFNNSRPIDMLIGAALFWELLCPESIQGSNQSPHFQKTKLGWIVGGFIPKPTHNQLSCHLMTIEQQISKFWEVEELPENTTFLTKEQVECDNHFKNTHYRESDGRFCVRLPFKPNANELGESRLQALKRFYNLEKKLQKNTFLKQQYTAFMNEYLTLGHMELISKSNNTISNGFYLPHHAVLNNNSLTTKVRVVFDGSAKSSTNISLNDTLMVGPTIQQNLVDILVRFRTYRYALTADITKMYRQVKLDHRDRDYHRIFWRPNPDEPLNTYRLTTVTYGTASAPFLAIRSLQEAASLAQSQFPHAYETILRDFYVDDLLTGANSIDDAKLIKNQVSTILSNCKFPLNKWASNEPSLIPTSEHLNQIHLIKSEDTRTLGLWWNCKDDTFKYKIPLSQNLIATQFTKRNILSQISQLFDPLGLISPIIITAKINMQKLWLLKVDWDDPLPEDQQANWNKYLSELSFLQNLQIPRRITPNYNIKKIEMHSFCDSSERAYGACLYIRCQDGFGNCSTQLLCSKSRVAPLKSISLPRLELCGALLLSRLKCKIVKNLGLLIHSYYNWTDSTIVLAWLSSPSNTWKTFVANRVQEIQSLTSNDTWNHISTHENPADFITRGVSPNTLLESNLWWEGPTWLTQHHSKWPTYNKQSVDPTNVPEARTLVHIVSHTNDDQFLKKFSSFSKLQRVIAYCLRFVRNCKHPLHKEINNLSVSDLQTATLRIIKIIQFNFFHKEIANLQINKQVDDSSKLISLTPFLDTDGLIRVGGRLKNAYIPFNKKHPIVLPNHHVTKLIILQEHLKQLHSGPQLTLSSLRERFWPLSGRTLVRGVIHKCIKCFKAKPHSLEQLMGNLPAHRLELTRPFLHCGIDYAGPMTVREKLGRGKRTSKVYIALFICLATRAVHIEIVSDLTADAFLAALTRFISRRGIISHIYSDNATNFVGASRELNLFKTLFNKQAKDKIIDSLSSNAITWHFIPPRSPHFGGSWEAGIKSVKFHLKRTAGNALLTYEELHTLLTKIEASLNSRPLTPIPTSPNDLDPLTPGHFLIGTSLTAPPEPDITNIKLNKLSRWQYVQQLNQNFWKRWKEEYLSQLQQRSKWKTVNSSISVGKMVLLRTQNTQPLQWPLGRIIKLHPGSDGITRVVTVKTATGEVTRAVTKICVLPEQISE